MDLSCKKVFVDLMDQELLAHVNHKSMSHHYSSLQVNVFNQEEI